MGDVERPTGAWTFGAFFFWFIAIYGLMQGLRRPESIASWTFLVVGVCLALYFGRQSIKIKRENARITGTRD